MTSCTMFSGISTFGDFLVWPTSCNYNFYLYILMAFMLVLGWRIYKSEEKRLGKGDLLSSFAISSLVFAVVAVFGTLINGETGNLAGIAMIQSDILLIFLAITIPLNAIWFFSKKT